MGRYGRDFGAGYPGRGGMAPYGRFPHGPPGRGGRRGREEWDASAPAPARGGPRRGWQTGEPWGGESAADRVRAGDVMTPNPEAVTPDTPLHEVARRMRDLDVGVIPVVDDLDALHLRGVITDRDIAIRAAAEGEDMKKARVEDFMTPEVHTVHENDHVRDVFTVMKRARVRRVPVVDAAGRLRGIVAQADLAVSYAGLDLQRETEVEEVIERVSEPARPRWGRERDGWTRRRYVEGGPVYDDGFRPEIIADRLRDGWDRLRSEARHLMGRGYDRGWR